MPDLGWPTSVQVDLRNFEIHSPPVVLREFAGIHGEKHGFTTQSGTVNGVKTFAVSDEQDAFRHAFVHGVKALELFNNEKYLNSIPLAPINKSDVQLFDSVANDALWWGFANEFHAPNRLPQHLKDLWNNGTGIELARRYLAKNRRNLSNMSNDGFAKFVADRIKNQSGLFILKDNDPRANTPALYNTNFLPDDALLTGNVAASHRLISLINREGFTPDLMEELHKRFPQKFSVSGFSPGKGDMLMSPPGNPTDPTSGFATEDDDDFYQMAEEVFSSLALDDWAVIHNDNDPFDNRDPFRNGVKWVPGLGPPPATPQGQGPWSGCLLETE